MFIFIYLFDYLFIYLCLFINVFIYLYMYICFVRVASFLGHATLRNIYCIFLSNVVMF